MEQVNIIKKKSKKAGSLDNLFKKLKSIKHIEYIIAAIFIGIMLLIIFSNPVAAKSEQKTIKLTLDQYGAALEEKLESILSRIDGAGKVDVMVTFEAGVEIITAMTTSKQSNTVTDEYSGGYRDTVSIIESNTPVIVGGQAVVLKEIQPKVKGAIVVCEGAHSVKVKVELVKALSTLLDLDTTKIEVFAMSKK